MHYLADFGLIVVIYKIRIEFKKQNQLRIIKETKKALQGIREIGQFTTNELDYCKMVFDHLLEECLKSIDELFLVITSGELEMKDNERIKRIDVLYADMQSKYSFSASFSEEMGLLSIQRMGERMEINQSLKIR